MSADGVGDCRILLLVERVIAAHHPLQLGKLADHVAGEIGLGQDRRALGKVWIGAHQLGDLAGEHAHALHPLILRAELLVKDDLAELRHALFEHHLAVVVEEEFGVGKPRCDHPLIAGDDGLAAILGLEVRHHDEAVGEMLAAPQREAFLMRLHRGGEHFARHIEEALIEAPHQRHRPFGEPGILGEQRHVLDQHELLLGRELLRALEDDRLALAWIEDDVGVAQSLRIVVEVPHSEGLRRHEAMAARLLAAFDAVDLERHHLAGEDAQDGMQRPHPAKPAASPAHGFRPGEVAHDLRHDLGHHFGRCAPRPLDQRHIEIALLVAADFSLLQRLEPGRFEEALHRRVRRADARALLLLAHVGRARRQAIDHHGKPARRGEAPHRIEAQARRPSARRRAAAPGPLRRASACAQESLRRTAPAEAQP